MDGSITVTFKLTGKVKNFNRWLNAVKTITERYNKATKEWETTVQQIVSKGIEGKRALVAMLPLPVEVTVDGKQMTVRELLDMLDIYLPYTGKWQSLPKGVVWEPPYFRLKITQNELKRLIDYMNYEDNFFINWWLFSPTSPCVAAVEIPNLKVEITDNNFCRYKVDEYKDVEVRVLKGQLENLLKVIGRESDVYNILFNKGLLRGIHEKPQDHMNIILRDYQIKAVYKAIRVLGYRGGGIIRLPTGAGKTVIASAVFNTLYDVKAVRSAAILAHSKSIVEQDIAKFDELANGDYAVGAIHSDSEEVGTVTGITMQSVVKAINTLQTDMSQLSDKQIKILEVLRNAGLIIIDEAHHVPAKTFRKVVEFIIGKPILGLTATPWREDSHDPLLYGYIGPLAYTLPIKHLIERGYIVPVKVVMMRPVWYAPNNICDDIVASSADEFYRKRWNKISSWLQMNKERHSYISAVALTLPKPVLILADLIDEVKSIAEEVAKRGMSVAVLTGEISSKKRIEILGDVREGKVDVVVATGVADEGIDIPNLRSLILANLGKSSIKLVQRIGRAVRPYEGKDTAYVVDIADKVYIPCSCISAEYDEIYCEDYVEYYATERHFKRRKAIYEQELGRNVIIEYNNRKLFKFLRLSI